MDRELNQEAQARRTIWVLFAWFAYPVVALLLVFMFFGWPFSLLSENFSSALTSISVPLAVFALTLLAARAGAPRSLRWLGLGYAILWFAFSTVMTANEVPLTQAVAANADVTLVMVLAGIACWLGFAGLFQRKQDAHRD